MAFESAMFPASLANDPNASPDAAGRMCLRHILDGIESESISARGQPIAEGSGFTAVVDSRATIVAIHLTWTVIGPTGEADRDVWTLQVWHMDTPLRALLLRRSSKHDRDVQSVRDAILRFIQRRTEQFSGIRVCTWGELES